VNAAALRTDLCKSFCSDLTVREVPAGFAVSASFVDEDGDAIGCFIERSAGGWRIVDDGQFLGDLSAQGLDLTMASRSDFLDRVLRPAGAVWDRATLQVETAAQSAEPDAEQVLRFLTALQRARDVAFWTRERVRSTFKDDVYRAIVDRFASSTDIWQEAPVESSLADFPADIVLRPRADNDEPPIVTAVFLVQAIEALSEALMLWQELQIKRKHGVRVFALLEDGSVSLSAPKAQRAVNRIDGVAFFRGDEGAVLDRIGRIAHAA
jgi:hypothetical protein